MRLLAAFQDYLRHERRYSAHTLSAYSSDVGQFAAFVQAQYQLDVLDNAKALPKLDAGLVRDWAYGLAAAKPPLTKRSLKRKLSALNTFFAFCMAKGWLGVNPADGVAIPKVDKPLPVFVREAEMATLLDQTAWPEGWEGLRDKLILELLYSCGLRRAELAGLTLQNFDRKGRMLRVWGKGRKERIVPYGKPVTQALDAYLEAATNAGLAVEKALLYSTKRRPISEQQVYAIVKKYLSSLGTLRKSSPHVLRHTFATHLVDNGADLNAVKELLGHSGLAATQVYVHNSIKKLKETHAKAHPKAKKLS
jgi:integrase/recombinase XerC